MNKKININPSSTKWLEKDDRVVADYFCDLGFRSLKQILDMRVFDLMNMQGLNAVRVEEVIICLYKWLNPNTAIDEAMFDPLPEEYFDKHTGKMKKRIVKYYPDEIRMKLGRSYSDYEALQQRSSFESLSGYMDTSGGAVPATVSEELAASISMQEQEKKRETLFGTIIGNGGDDDVRNNE